MTCKVKKGDKRVCRYSETLKTFIQHWQCIIKKLQNIETRIVCAMSAMYTVKENKHEWERNYVKMKADTIKQCCLCKKKLRESG